MKQLIPLFLSVVIRSNIISLKPNLVQWFIYSFSIVPLIYMTKDLTLVLHGIIFIVDMQTHVASP